MVKYKVVHYINQFFAGIGGEEKTDYTPEFREEAVGSGKGLKVTLREDYGIMSTVICDDSYFGKNLDAVADTIVGMVKKCEPDVFAASPTFNTGRYSVAYGTICKAMEERLDIPVITGMCIENPNVDMFRKDLIIVETPNFAVGMPEVLPVMSALIEKAAAGTKILGPREEGYTGRGIRVNYFTEKKGSKRAPEMPAKKLKGEEYGINLPMPKPDKVTPAELAKDIKHIKIAVVTSDGIVLTGSPDHIESSNAVKWGKYDITGMNCLSPDEFTTIHGGYDRQFAITNPDVVAPLDALRKLEKVGEFGGLVNYFCTTTGTETAAASAARFGSEIGRILIDEHVDVVILVSTWGTCTRCSATVTKGIEKYGIPVVHMVTVIPTSLTIGVSRIIPDIGIPYPLGDPSQDEKDSYKLRLSMVRRALEALQTPVNDQTVFEK